MAPIANADISGAATTPPVPAPVVGRSRPKCSQRCKCSSSSGRKSSPLALPSAPSATVRMFHTTNTTSSQQRYIAGSTHRPRPFESSRVCPRREGCSPNAYRMHRRRSADAPLSLPAPRNDRRSWRTTSRNPPVRSPITHLGWGIDQVVADATLIDQGFTAPDWGAVAAAYTSGATAAAVHCCGSLAALMKRHVQFLNRLQGGWTPVSPLSAFDQVPYRRETDPVPRPQAVLRLVDGNEDAVAYSHARLVDIAGMVRHAAIEVISRNSPRDLRGLSPQQWVRSIRRRSCASRRRIGRPISRSALVRPASVDRPRTHRPRRTAHDDRRSAGRRSLAGPSGRASRWSTA